MQRRRRGLDQRCALSSFKFHLDLCLMFVCGCVPMSLCLIVARPPVSFVRCTDPSWPFQLLSAGCAR